MNDNEYVNGTFLLKNNRFRRIIKSWQLFFIFKIKNIQIRNQAIDQIK